MSLLKKALLTCSAGLGVVYLSNYVVMTSVESYSIAKLSRLEERLEYHRNAIEAYLSGTPASDERLRVLLYLDAIALRVQQQIEDEKFAVEFWRKARYKPLKTINMMTGAKIYNDPDLR